MSNNEREPVSLYPIRHGYYSPSQAEMNGKIYVYHNQNNEEIETTVVISIKKNDITKYYSDTRYVGEVTKYIRTIIINKNSNLFK